MLEHRLLRSAHELREIGQAWNELWEHSDSTSALTRSEPLAIWLEHFADGREIRVVTVWKKGRLVAGLPLLIGKKKGLKVAELPNNEWSFSGDLLIAENPIQSLVVDELVRGINQVETLAVWLDWIKVDQPKWKLLIERLKAKHQSSFAKPRFSVSQIPSPDSFEEYQKSLSKNHRKKMKRGLRDLGEHGTVELADYDSSKLLEQLDEAFLIEHRGWKGQDGTSIKSDSQIESHFRKLAVSLHQDGMLALQFLRVGNRAIAFDFGYVAKGVRGSHKISFDAEFAKSSPGQVLVAKQIENAKTIGIENFDTIGPATDATLKWTDESYEVGRIFLSNSRWTSRVTVGAMGQLSRILNKIKSPVGSF